MVMLCCAITQPTSTCLLVAVQSIAVATSAGKAFGKVHTNLFTAMAVCQTLIVKLTPYAMEVLVTATRTLVCASLHHDVIMTQNGSLGNVALCVFKYEYSNKLNTEKPTLPRKRLFISYIQHTMF